jgi:lipoyl(octanoyl) transferase
VPENAPLRTLNAYRLGRQDYAQAHALQERLVALRQQDQIGDTLLLLEHDPVITLGRAANRDNIVWGLEQLRERGVTIHETGRGGDVTYHGPGQLVAYPIISLAPERQDVRKYVWALEETMIRLAADHGLVAERSPGFNGTWIGSRKIGAVGVRISRWVTMHGFAFNISTDLSAFQWIVPCGITDRGVTSLQQELGAAPEWIKTETRAAEYLAEILGFRILWIDGGLQLADLPLDRS